MHSSLLFEIDGLILQHPGARSYGSFAIWYTHFPYTRPRLLHLLCFLPSLSTRRISVFAAFVISSAQLQIRRVISPNCFLTL